MAAFVTPNSWARTSMRNTTTKKSNASRVHPRKAAVTACAEARGLADPVDIGLPPPRRHHGPALDDHRAKVHRPPGAHDRPSLMIDMYADLTPSAVLRSLSKTPSLIERNDSND